MLKIHISIQKENQTKIGGLNSNVIITHVNRKLLAKCTWSTWAMDITGIRNKHHITLYYTAFYYMEATFPYT
jgi:hypothetical protein